MVSWKGNDEEGANMLKIRIWVEGAVLEYDPRCVAKNPGIFQLRIGTQGGGHQDANTN